ncbi:MAG: TIGR03084 family protein [Alphaproteobacteria bacterium]|nr:TIGR03084 family protein [Alphaproteobacteria bacterium]
MNEAQDFADESRALTETLERADAQALRKVTLFKDWTIEDVIAHLHMWNIAAGLTLDGRDAFQEFFAGVAKHLMAGKTHPQVQRLWFDETQNGLHGRALLEAWRDYCPKLARAYGDAGPNTRVAWAGPDMTTRSKMIARQMETWAHGQAVFDVLGIAREEKDRIRNICHLGVTTYSWTFKNRQEDVPLPKPYVRLTAPSGAIWEWNDVQDDNAVIGEAVHFAQIVTQTRNVADTPLQTHGVNAARWMDIAQCFAGAPESPPAKGARYKI